MSNKKQSNYSVIKIPVLPSPSSQIRPRNTSLIIYKFSSSLPLFLGSWKPRNSQHPLRRLSLLQGGFLACLTFYFQFPLASTKLKLAKLRNKLTSASASFIFWHLTFYFLGSWKDVEIELLDLQNVKMNLHTVILKIFDFQSHPRRHHVNSYQAGFKKEIKNRLGVLSNQRNDLHSIVSTESLYSPAKFWTQVQGRISIQNYHALLQTLD